MKKSAVSLTDLRCTGASQARHALLLPLHGRAAEQQWQMQHLRPRVGEDAQFRQFCDLGLWHALEVHVLAGLFSEKQLAASLPHDHAKPTPSPKP